MKGIRFERAVAQWLETVTTRSSRPGVHDDAGDVVIDGFLIECRDRARWNVELWWLETVRKADELGLEPILILKRPRHGVGDALAVTRIRTMEL